MTATVDAGFQRSVIRSGGAAVKRVETFDVVIIGSSVCGAALAAILGEAGVSAAVVAERQGSLRKGPQTAFSVSKPVDCPTLSSAECNDKAFFKIVSSGGKTLNVLKDNRALSFFSVPQLETLYINRAARACVRVYRGGAVTLFQENGCWVVSASDTTIRGRVVIGADGWNSVVRKAVNAPLHQKDLYFAAGCTAFMNEENGVKISLLENGRFCRMISYGSKASVAVLGPASDIVTPRLIFDKIIRSDLAPVGSIISYQTAFVPSPASTEFYSLPCAGKNWILLGEAAGHVHPMSGAYLHYAVRGAKLAAQAIECGEPRVFDSLWRDDYGRELKAAVKLKNRMNKRRRFTELAFRAAELFPQISANIRHGFRM